MLQILELHELKVQRPHPLLPAHAHLAQYPRIQDEERDAAQQRPQILEPHLRGTAEEEGVLVSKGTNRKRTGAFGWQVIFDAVNNNLRI